MKSTEENRHGVYIEIWLDASERISRIEINDWYTGL